MGSGPARNPPMSMAWITQSDRLKRARDFCSVFFSSVFPQRESESTRHDCPRIVHSASWEPAAFDVAPESSRLSKPSRSEEHTSELQSLAYLVCRLLLEKQ